VVWNAGLTKEPEIQRIIKKNVYALRREWKGMRRWTRENKRNKKRWHTHGRRRYGLYLSLDSLVYSTSSRHHACPFFWVQPLSLGLSRLVGPQGRLKLTCTHYFFFRPALTDADGAAVRLSFFCLAVSSPI
jgi:hypothetical protein